MPPKLLLADDSITVQRVIALTFSGEGLDVITVGDGDRAVERIAADQPEIVLADVSMPGLDGYAVAEFVKRSAEHAARTRVVLLTGAFEAIDEGRTKALGIDGVLAKPFEPQVAIGLVKHLLELEPLQPSALVEPGSLPGVDADGDRGPDGAADREHDRSPDSAIGSLRPSRASEWASGATGEAEGASAGGGMAAGYPFEPRAEDNAPSTELDDYFRRLDEALAVAGLGPPPGAGADANVATAAPDAARSEEVGMDAVTVARHDVVAFEPQLEPTPPRTIGEEMFTMEPPSTHVDAAAALDDASTIILPAPADAETGAASRHTGSLVDTFAALLAVEQGEPGARAPEWTPAPAPAVEAGSEAMIEAVARRVIARLTDAKVHELVEARVLDVAERLVREEIARIKASAE